MSSLNAVARAPEAQRKLRLAYVVKMFPRFSETFILNEILELERLGHEVTIYSLKRPAPGPVHPGLAAVRARVVYLPERPIEWLTRGLAAGGSRLSPRLFGYIVTRGNHQAWKRFFQAACLARDLERHPADHLHAHFASAPSRVAMFAAHLARLPWSFTAHAKDIYQQSTDRDLLRDKIRAASFAVTVSDYNRSYLEALVSDPAAAARGSWPFARPGPATVRRLYNGVDLELFAPCAHTSRRPTVLAVGRLVEKKGFDDLLRAWPEVRARHPDARLVIVGEGPEKARLQALTAPQGPAGGIEWVGAEPQDRVRERLASATIFCLPCRVAQDGNRDGLPTVLLEALASGVPCVSTEVAGIPEIFSDGVEGRLVPPGNTEALAHALLDLLERGALGRMRVAARARAEQCFNLRVNVARLASWFAEPRPS